ncbi:mitochondrial ubiquitin ligase activator of nfkb 1 [Stylonychia lemnae]|uniref:Mitochondrial ubiquitin ligase activator of nfkb 1 n=1 Tax=Stylonychia lemnae TaxID=5949 RepID=A0A077ZTK9_STYLE|nr:mitochondrial ubiquitin ligase activator of nfkb 1 [Stylonychia lemnae]|eukprot:CDW72844.1 mitochondrial ubiquitin ligase activator of nfkb 1 [Stylonychia lemnae]
MEEEIKALSILLSLGVLSGCLAVSSHFRLIKLRNQKESVKKQGQIYDAQYLNENKDKFKQPEFVMVNGLLVQEKTLHYLTQDPKNHLLKKLNKSKTLYYTIEQVSMQRDRNRLIKFRSPKVQEFQLVSDDGKHRAAVKPGDSADCINLTQSRSTHTQIRLRSPRIDYFERIQYMACEGTNLTLMGTVAYNASRNELQLTDVASFVAGGMKDAVSYLKKEINYYYNVRLWSAVASGFCLTILGLYVLSKITQSRMKAQTEIKKEQAQKLIKSKTLQLFSDDQASKSGVVCSVCLTNASNVIAVPCNHLSTCNECYYQLRDRYLSGQSTDFKCPYCRVPMDGDKYIIVNCKNVGGQTE